MAEWLRIRDLAFSYRGRPVLAGLSASFPERGIVVCSGPSGVGKSTLGLLLTGHLAPARGEILVDEVPISGPSRRAIAVSQDDDLFPWLRMRDQLDFFAPLPGTLTQWKPLALRLGLEGAEELYPKEMSGGMRKRLALLRATLLRPSLLVLDETLGSVEPELRERILADFDGIWRELGIGVLLITHDLPPGIRSRCIGELRLARS